MGNLEHCIFKVLHLFKTCCLVAILLLLQLRLNSVQNVTLSLVTAREDLFPLEKSETP